jgi:hypothetical protein
MGFHAYQTNFTGGVLAPKMFSRVDFAKYANGLETLENGVVFVTGGASRRAGSQFIAKSKSTAFVQDTMVQDDSFQSGHHDSVVLRDFVFNTDDAMVLEWGPGYIRFFKNREQVYGSGSGSELVTNGTFDADLTGWTLQQDNGGTATWVAGRAALAPGAVGAAGISQTLSGLVQGTRYVIEFSVDGGNADFDIGSTLGGGDIFDTTEVTPGNYRLVFTAPGTTAVINFLAVASASTTYVDGVTVKEAVPLEITTPYLASDIRSLRFAQSADTMYVAHRSHPPQKLTRLADTLWTIQDVVFSPPPTEEINITPAAVLTPGATTGFGVHFTTDVAAFLAGDRGRQIFSRGGVAVITSVNTSQDVTVDITSAFISTDPIGAGSWSMDGSPNAGATISAAAPVNDIITVTLDTAGFRSNDLGAFLHINDWIFEITNVTSDVLVSAKVLKVREDGAGLTAVAGSWTLERDSWSAENGYPECVAFFEQRLLFSKGQGFWGSRIGDFENFGRGPNDDDSYFYPIASGQVDLIRWIKAMDFMLFGTIGTEYKIDAGVDLTITPNNPPKASPQSAWGSDPEPDAIRAGAAVIFLQRGRQQIREMGKAFEAGVDAYSAADISVLASHLFTSGVTEMARTSSPASYLFAVLSNGSMAVATYERPENVVAWGKFTTDGRYKSVCVIPNKCGSGDEVWALVERTINGRSDLYVEVFDGQLNTDCALVYEGTDQTADGIVGLSHLEGEEVDVVHTSLSAFQSNVFQMGAFQPVHANYFVDTVEGGFIALPVASIRAEAGLHYETTIKTLRIEVGGQSGTAHFRAKRSNTIYVRFLCTRGPGVTVDGELVPEERVLEVRDWTKEANLGWNRNGQVTIKQTMPYPMTVLGISYAYQIDDGDAPVGDSNG